MKFSIAVARALILGLLVAIADSATAQQAYPSKPIRVIVPAPPGGTNDVLARIVGQSLAERFGVQVLIENRAGATFIIGSEALLKSAPDGYAMMVTSSTHLLTSLLMPTRYDAVKDFAAVATIGSSEQVLVLHPSVPANNLKEFIVLAKSRPGQLNYGSAGKGGIQHLAAELFSMMAAVKMEHVPYKGGAPLVTDLIAGQVQLAFANPANVLPYVKTGKLKALAISGDTRLPALPQMPTFAETGLPGFDVKMWFGVLAPVGTPKPAIDKVSTEIGKILAIPNIKEKLFSQGVDPFISTADQFGGLMKADMAKFARVVKMANIKLAN